VTANIGGDKKNMKITIFEGYSLSNGGHSYRYGDGDGRGNGNGDGNGNGNGDGDGRGNGEGYEYGNGNGFGYSNGYSYGNGNGFGNGEGHSYGDGYGYGKTVAILLSSVFAYHIISGYSHHAGKDIDTEHNYNAGENIGLCEHGLHASLELEDARYYTRGTETRVQCSGRVMFGFDKLVCEHREVVRVL
jgi:hypothetical protein